MAAESHQVWISGRTLAPTINMTGRSSEQLQSSESSAITSEPSKLFAIDLLIPTAAPQSGILFFEGRETRNVVLVSRVLKTEKRF
jgi:hypothetical protein